MSCWVSLPVTPRATRPEPTLTHPPLVQLCAEVFSERWEGAQSACAAPASARPKSLSRPGEDPEIEHDLAMPPQRKGAKTPPVHTFVTAN